MGKWHFIGFIYHGQFRLPLTPNLFLTFTFQNDGTSILFWNRTGEPGFCERKGRFSIEQENLVDEVVWVNPKNSIDCGQDPDMQMGKKSTNAISLKEEKFHLEIGLAGEPFTYVFERLETEPPTSSKHE